MKLLLFGATGMVGAGALREALADREVEAVLAVGRRRSGVEHPKLRELLLPDLFDLAAVEPLHPRVRRHQPRGERSDAARLTAGSIPPTQARS